MLNSKPPWLESLQLLLLQMRRNNKMHLKSARETQKIKRKRRRLKPKKKLKRKLKPRLLRIKESKKN